MKLNLFGSIILLILALHSGRSLASQQMVNAVYKCEAVRTQASPNQVGGLLAQNVVSPSVEISIPASRAKGSRFVRPGSLTAADLSFDDQAKVERVKKEAMNFRSECRWDRVNPLVLVFQVAVLWCSLKCTVEVI